MTCLRSRMPLILTRASICVSTSLKTLGRRLDRHHGHVGRGLARPERHGEDGQLVLAHLDGLLHRRQAPVVLPVGEQDDAQDLAVAGAGALQGAGQRQAQVGERRSRARGLVARRPA